MDFVKSLMLFMTLTFATGVQGADAPTATPVPTETPTPAPTAVVETAAPATETLPVETAIDTQTPPPASKATAEPVPTITPNTHYKLLRYGSRGDDVRRLQERLAELGYLTGNIDGAYGYQTRNAVVKFQQYNGLKADGEAGKATLTCIYEDPNVVPNPERVTPSPVPTATPDASGLIPRMENPRSIWVEKRGATVLIGTEAATAPVHVWQRGAELVVNLSELSAAAGWTLTGEAAEACTLSAQGHEVALTALPVALERMKDEKDYCDAYTMTIGGASAATHQGDWMFEDGVWYAATGALEQAFSAEVVWDEDENTLIVRVLPVELAGADD